MNFTKILCSFAVAIFNLTAVKAESAELSLENGIGSREIQNGSVKSSPLGRKYCELNSFETGNARIVVPALNLETSTQNHVVVQFKYRTQVAGSRMNDGVWVYAGFRSAEGESITPYQGLALQKASQWKDEEWEILIPENASELEVQFRIQGRKGIADFRDIALKEKSARKDREKVERPDNNFEIMAEFHLKQENGKAVLESKDFVLTNCLDGNFPYSFVLPEEYCHSEGFIYETEIEFVPNWDTTKENTKSYALFTLGRNMTGQIQPDSMSLMFWKGDTVYARQTASSGSEKAQTFYRKFTFSKGKSYTAGLRFNNKGIKLFWDKKLLAEQELLEGFSWPADRAFYIGGEDAETSIFEGDIKAFTLKILKPVINCKIAGGLDSGYFYGDLQHTQKLEFPDGSGKSCSSVVSIQDIDGSTIAKGINPSEKSEKFHTFTLPRLPFGWYEFHYEVTSGKHLLRKKRPFVVLPEKLAKDNPDSSPFGFVADVGYFHDNPETIRRIDREFRLLSAMGMQWIRITLSWDKIERQPGQYDFHTFDAIVDLAEKYDLQINIMLIGGKKPFQSWVFKEEPRWYVRPQFGLPYDMKLWKNYLKTFAGRYKGIIQHYQIWGEPDTRCALYPFKTEKYVEILSESNRTLKSIDKDIQVGLGGFCVALEGRYLKKTSHKDSDAAWGAAEFYNLNPHNDFDIVAVHLYSLENPRQIWDKNMEEVLRMKKFLASEGESDKPLWNTETSFFTGTPGTKGGWTGDTDMISEKTQAARLVQLYIESAVVGIDKTFWYGTRGRTGVLNSDFSPKPNYAACSVLADKLAGMKYSSTIPLDGTMHGYRFIGPKRNLAVLWTNYGKVPLVATPEDSAEITFCDMMGNTSRLDAKSGFAVVEAGQLPCYIQSQGEFSLRPVAQVKLPETIIENEPVDVELSLMNPSPESTVFTVGAMLGDSNPVIKKVILKGKESKKEKLLIVPETGILIVEIRAEGGLNNNFVSRTKCRMKKSLVLAENKAVTVLINREEQVGLGHKVIDMQNRVMVPCSWQGKEDLNAKIDFTKQGKDICFEAFVWDDEFHPAPETSSAIYEGDALELFFDFSKEGEMNPEDIYQAIVGADGRLWFLSERKPKGFEAETERLDKGYKVTGKFTVPDNVEKSFGFDIAIDDADKNKEDSRHTQMVWSETRNGHDPEFFGIVILK